MTPEEIAAMQAENAKLKSDLEAAKKPPTPPTPPAPNPPAPPTPPKPEDDPSLADKVRAEREAAEKKQGESKLLENAMRFNMGGAEWLKTNASLLPKNIPDLFKQAEKENYGSEIEKANAIKVGIVSEFFAQQSNLDLLTPGLKTALEDFLKLTKTVKHERASAIWDSVLEPALEMLKRTTKAAQLNRGLGTPTDAEQAYKDRLMKGSRKHYLGEKENGT